MSEIEDLKFTSEWTKKLLEELDSIRKKDNIGVDIETAIGRCSEVCFKKNQFNIKLKGFSDLEQFLGYCKTGLGWEIDYHEENQTIICYEHNESCLCPIVRCCDNGISNAMCCCTQGEIKRMFEYALGRAVDVEIVHSFIRDGQSCVYKVTLL